MERDKFNNDITEALRRTLAAPPEGMTERFMERLRKEKYITKTFQKKRNVMLWIALPSLVAAAAAICFVVLLPTKKIPTEQQSEVRIAQIKKEPQHVTLPSQIAYEHAYEQPEAMKSVKNSKSVKASKVKMLRAVENTVQWTSNSTTETIKDVILSADTPQVAEFTSQETINAEKHLMVHAETIVNSPATPPSVSESSINKIKGSQPGYTPEEIQLMRRAEQVRLQALLYAAEITQENIIASQLQNSARSRHKQTQEEKPIIVNI